MTLKEILRIIEANEDQFMSKKMGDAGHVIEGFEVIKNTDNKFEINLIGVDRRSGVAVVTKKLEDWLRDNGLQLL